MRVYQFHHLGNGTILLYVLTFCQFYAIIIPVSQDIEYILHITHPVSDKHFEGRYWLSSLMETLYISLALIVAITGVVPVGPESINTVYADTDSNMSVLHGVNPVETIITPKPVKVAAKPVTVQTQKSFFASVDKELQNIPAQGSCFDYVPEMAQKYGVDADLMTRIIRAESGGNPLAKNKNSTASGCGQFIRGTWAGTLRQMGVEWVTPFDAKMNVEAMAFKISRGGIRAWDASKSKWSK